MHIDILGQSYYSYDNYIRECKEKNIKPVNFFKFLFGNF